MGIQITPEDMKLKDRRELEKRILKRVEAYNESKYESRGEILTEIQILTSRVESISAEKTERRSLFLEVIVILLITVEVYQGWRESGVLDAVSVSSAKTIAVLEHLETALPH